MRCRGLGQLYEVYRGVPARPDHDHLGRVPETGSDLEAGDSQGLPVWSRHVGNPILESNLTRRVDFALFMVDTLTNDELIREAPRSTGLTSCGNRRAWVLPEFVAAGTSLVWTWFATAWTYAILAVPILLLPAALGRCDDAVLRVATYLGATSVVLSLVGFLRWVFVVPALAHSNVTGNAVTQSAAEAAWYRSTPVRWCTAR